MLTQALPLLLVFAAYVLNLAFSTKPTSYRLPVSRIAENYRQIHRSMPNIVLRNDSPRMLDFTAARGIDGYIPFRRAK